MTVGDIGLAEPPSELSHAERRLYAPKVLVRGTVINVRFETDNSLYDSDNDQDQLFGQPGMCLCRTSRFFDLSKCLAIAEQSDKFANCPPGRELRFRTWRGALVDGTARPCDENRALPYLGDQDVLYNSAGDSGLLWITAAHCRNLSTEYAQVLAPGGEPVCTVATSHLHRYPSSADEGRILGERIPTDEDRILHALAAATGQEVLGVRECFALQFVADLGIAPQSGVQHGCWQLHVKGPAGRMAGQASTTTAQTAAQMAGSSGRWSHLGRPATAPEDALWRLLAGAGARARLGALQGAAPLPSFGRYHRYGTPAVAPGSPTDRFLREWVVASLAEHRGIAVSQGGQWGDHRRPKPLLAVERIERVENQRLVDKYRAELSDIAGLNGGAGGGFAGAGGGAPWPAGARRVHAPPAGAGVRQLTAFHWKGSGGNQPLGSGGSGGSTSGSTSGSIPSTQWSGSVDANALQEYFLFHGSTHDALDRICQGGFDPRRGGARGGRLFGTGAYFAENASKADRYTEARGDGAGAGVGTGAGASAGASGRTGLRCMLVARVCLGATHLTKDPLEDITMPPERPDGGGALNSVTAEACDAGGCVDHREYIVYTGAQALPEFRIWYRHAPGCGCFTCDP